VVRYLTHLKLQQVLFKKSPLFFTLLGRYFNSVKNRSRTWSRTVLTKLKFPWYCFYKARRCYEGRNRFHSLQVSYFPCSSYSVYFHRLSTYRFLVDIPHSIVEECRNIPRIFLQTIKNQKKRKVVEPIGSGSGSRDLIKINSKILLVEIYFYLIKKFNTLIPRPPRRISKLQKKTPALKRGHHALRNMKFLHILRSTSLFCPSGSGCGSESAVQNQCGCGYGSAPIENIRNHWGTVRYKK
jgi:hypothetical protein